MADVEDAVLAGRQTGRECQRGALAAGCDGLSSRLFADKGHKRDGLGAWALELVGEDGVVEWEWGSTNFEDRGDGGSAELVVGWDVAVGD